jgi:alanine racemase
MTPVVRAIVDSAALRHNLGRVRETAPGCPVLAVIKANAYGHGIVPAAVALAGADGFAVARLEEGIALREAGLAHRVLLLEGVFGPEQLRLAAHHGFDIMVHEPEQLALLEAADAGSRFRAWFKIDTGMNRLGFKPAQVPSALARLRACPAVAGAPTLVTHLADADAPDPARTLEQLRQFGALVGEQPGERSIANSAGLIGCEAARVGWVRPGLMLYGVSPFPEGDGEAIGLRPAMKLVTQVIAVKEIEPGERVGYGGIWQAGRRTRLAIAACGYGDGYPRNTVSGTPVRVGGGQAGIVGRVSMDMLAIDVTDLPPVPVGEEVLLWGPGLPVESVARAAGTIPYELVCGVSQRVHLDVR